LTIHNKQWHNFAASEARALGDIISESTGSIISECPGDFIGIRNGGPLGDAGLADLDAELEQFAMDPRRSPQRIGNARLADQPPYFGRNRRSAGTRT
jgi:hypothetical protein